MLYYLIGLCTGDAGQGPWAALGPLRAVAFRIVAAALTGFLVALLAGPRAIEWLRRRWRERIQSDSERLAAMHRGKQDTPTLGGLLVLAALAGSALLWADLAQPLVLLGLLVTGGLGALGAVDDLTKLRGARRGISEREKLTGQFVVGLAAGVGLCLCAGSTPAGPEQSSAWFAPGRQLGWLLVPWAALVIAASSNGVNLTDGLDGLAGGCFIFTAAAVGLLNYVAGTARVAGQLGLPHVPASGEIAVLVAAASGATLGFLWFNCHPAQVFLGDTGALALGGLLGYAALVPRQELLLVIAGGVFVAEAASVIVQRYCFKATGRRVLRCAPLHHHYQFLGWPEPKIVVRFWIAAAFLSALAVATLKLR